MVLAIIALFTVTFTFPVLAKFDNTIKNTYRNSFFMSCRHFPTTLVMIRPWSVTILTGYLFPQLLIVHILILFSLAAFVPSFMLVKVFDRYIPAEEPEEEEETADSEGITENTAENTLSVNGSDSTAENTLSVNGSESTAENTLPVNGNDNTVENTLSVNDNESSGDNLSEGI